MKIKQVLPLSTLLLCSATLMLTGCESMGGMFGSSNSSNPDHTYHTPQGNTAHQGGKGAQSAQESTAKGSTKGGVIKSKSVTATSLADPGESAVVHPKTAPAPAAVPLAAPSVAQ